MQVASEYCQIEVVKILIEHGADIHTDNDWPLAVSAERKPVHIIYLLINNGCKFGMHQNVVKLSLDNGFKLWSSTYMQHTVTNRPKIIEFAINHDLDRVKYCLDTGADIHAKIGHTEVVRLLLDHGCKFNECHK